MAVANRLQVNDYFPYIFDKVSVNLLELWWSESGGVALVLANWAASYPTCLDFPAFVTNQVQLQGT